MEESIKNFAPVMIPTLCRSQHFKECVESLKRCRWADKTDVFIGLDYPANASHREGYKEICIYLNELEKNHPFKTLNVIRRECNYGLGREGNSAKLREEILKNYDRVIFSEDDNVFSPAFLDFINRGLERFKDDKSIQAICGYRHFYIIKTGKENFYRQSVDFSAWGYGTWKDRIEELNKIDPLWFKSRLNLKEFLKFKKNQGNRRALQFLKISNMNPIKFGLTDNVISVYMGLTGKDVVMPEITCVKNMGLDGSGVNFNDADPKLKHAHSSQSLYSDNLYELHGDGFYAYSDNKKVHIKQSYDKLNDILLLKDVLKESLKTLLRKIF